MPTSRKCGTTGLLYAAASEKTKQLGRRELLRGTRSRVGRNMG